MFKPRMFKPRLSIRTLLVATALVAIVVFLQVRLSNRIRDFEAGFSDVSNVIHRNEGNGRISSIRDVAVDDMSTLTDRLLFRRRIVVAYIALTIDDVRTHTAYDCNTEFLIGQYMIHREQHTAIRTMTWR